ELVEQAGTVFEVANTIRGLIENHWEFPKGIDQNEEEVEELLEKGRFSDDLVVNDLSWIGQVLPTPSLVVETVKRKKNEIMQHLRNDEVQKIGVYGMPGVGKTSAVTLVNNELLKGEIELKIIVWVTVARKCSVIELQNKIAKAM
ncbi:hypothetical protein Goshw_028632, partial [Gossypium schwendimanii]|nr:hypothetical protein [Gossypium schwendimanii]